MCVVAHTVRRGCFLILRSAAGTRKISRQNHVSFLYRPCELGRAEDAGL